MHEWILSLILGALPSQTPEPLEYYDGIATDVSTVVEAEGSLFKGPHGKHRTAALLLAVAWHESGFSRRVDTGEVRGDRGNSCTLWQFNLGPTKCKPLLQNRQAAVRQALVMIRQSRNVCRSPRPEDMLRVYASGSCQRGSRESRVRVQTAFRWFARRPPGPLPDARP